MNLLDAKNYAKTQRKKEPPAPKSAALWTPNRKVYRFKIFELKKNIFGKELYFLTKRLASEDTNDNKSVAQRDIVDSVWLMKEYKAQTYSIEDAIEFHKELAQPAMFNNLNGFCNLRIILDMKSKKKVNIL